MKTLTLDVRTTPVSDMTDRFYSLGYPLQSDLFKSAHKIEKIQRKKQNLLIKLKKIQARLAELSIQIQMIEEGVN